MRIKRFDDINCWIEARELTKNIYDITSKGYFVKDFGLTDQIRRASVSIMANITEGFASQSNEEFIRFLIYARRSCGEVQSHLYVAADQKYISQEVFDGLYKKSIYTAKLINAFITYLRSSGKGISRSTRKLVNRSTSVVSQ